MGGSTFEKGYEDAKKGNDPDPIKQENSLSDYVFVTTVSKEERESAREEYLEGFKAGSNQSKKDEK